MTNIRFAYIIVVPHDLKEEQIVKKKIFSLILTGIMSLSLALSSCQYILPKSVVGASLNEKGELILVYSDNTTQNVGVVKGEDGKDGQDGKDGLNGENGKDLTACEHVYGNWETGLAPSCTSIGYDTRVCALCGDLDYQFTKELGHNYENAKDVVSIPGEQHLVNKTCSLCGDTKILEHNYNEKGVCPCGEITHFIESDEYIIEGGYDYGFLHTWMSIDGSYGLQIMSNPFEVFIYGYVGTPVNVILPTSFKGNPIKNIGGGYGYGSQALPFKNCKTLESIRIPKNMDIYVCGEAHPFIGCSNLKYIYFPKVTHSTPNFKEILPDVEIIYYD